jgi:hypothetical protein
MDFDAITPDNLPTLARDSAARRRFLAGELLRNPRRSAASLAREIGVHESTVRADWRDETVRRMARELALAPLLPTVIACARYAVAMTAARAAAGDLDAGRVLQGWLKTMHAGEQVAPHAGAAMDAALEAAASVDAGDVPTPGLGLLSSLDALAALEAAEREAASMDAREQEAGPTPPAPTPHHPPTGGSE